MKAQHKEWHQSIAHWTFINDKDPFLSKEQWRDMMLVKNGVAVHAWTSNMAWTSRMPQSSKWRPLLKEKNNRSLLHQPTVANLQSWLRPKFEHHVTPYPLNAHPSLLSTSTSHDTHYYSDIMHVFPNMVTRNPWHTQLLCFFLLNQSVLCLWESTMSWIDVGGL